MYQIVQGVIYSNILVKKQLYFPLLYFLFSIILTANIIGLIPFAFTLTSSFIITIFFSLILFLIVILTAIYYNEWKISNLFLPEDVPLLITPGIIVIEFISFFARVFSLSIRLFANMMSGHALMKILSSFA
jgi:ATP synthase subunit 6